jgi:hypothetical protein
LINGYRTTGKFYAIVSFFLNLFYYDYWFISIQNPTTENIKTAVNQFFHLPYTFSFDMAAKQAILSPIKRGENRILVQRMRCWSVPRGRWMAIWQKHTKRVRRGQNKKGA